MYNRISFFLHIWWCVCIYKEVYFDCCLLWNHEKTTCIGFHIFKSYYVAPHVIASTLNYSEMGMFS